MGIPKFYYWISKRYPCLNEVIKEQHIPDFDNLYLDMNDIIHTCSHPDDDNPFFRITEEKIFAGIFHHIDFLFKMIKPKKVLFMAVDGVASRAKMKLQRCGRFQVAKTAEVQEEEARRLGILLPAEARFDENCVTPGTVFMTHLHEKLKGFVAYKISTDVMWQNIRVYLSGHDTPGEGEHKIIEFIRYEKSQPGYNPNTRHCLYGHDADLIMLGLCVHEPYFAILRNELRFGQPQNKIITPDETTFNLLHISLLRDYLEHEFSPVKDKLSFKYDVESIIDDFILISFLVGNDFIPRLPKMHIIDHDALSVLFKTYIDVLPMLEGYINLQGHLHLERFEIFLKKLAEYDFQKFVEEKYMKDKDTGKHEANASQFSNACMDDLENQKSALEMEFVMHKTKYYMITLDVEEITPAIMKEQAQGYVKTIQWILHCYYNRVISWSWYYPYYYSPYISDLKDFKNMEMHFEMDKPLLPFQQQLAILPKQSKDLLPNSYQKLMCNEDSPLSDYFLDEQEIVLLPLINEKQLLTCAKIADQDLTEAERKRNKHGPHLLFTFTENSSGPGPSFLPGYFPSLETIHVKMTKVYKNFFRLPPNSLVKGLHKGIKLDKFILGFPTLRSIKHSAHLSNEKVKVFQFFSRNENMMLTINDFPKRNLQKLADSILGQVIYVGWPYFHAALVVGVSSGETQCKYEKNDSMHFQVSDMKGSERVLWAKRVQSFISNFYERWGIFVGDVDVLVHVKHLSGTKHVFSDGKISAEQKWESSVSYYALQTTITNTNRFKNIEDKSLKNLLSAGLIVFLLEKSYYGYLGTIVKTNGGNLKEIVVKVESSAEPALQPIMENQAKYVSEEFMPSYIAANHLGVDADFFSRLTGFLKIQTNPKDSSTPAHVNIGLNLKFNQKNEEVCRFTKKHNNKWLYSKKVVKTIGDYLSEFTDFFEKLKPFIQMDVVYLEDIYPEGETDIIDRIIYWLKAQAFKTAEHQPCGMEKLDLSVVSAIERCVDDAIEKKSTYQNVTVNLQEIYIPFFCTGVCIPDPSVINFRLFDRVVNVCCSSTVPLGLKGTVIGICKAITASDYMYEILFDRKFLGGLSSSSFSRCYYMPPHKLINLSHGERIKKFHAFSLTNKPRIDRNVVFSTIMNHLQQSGPQQNPVKTDHKPSLNNEEPICKMDSSEMSAVNSQFQLPTSNIESSSKTLFKPKMSRLNSGHSKEAHSVWDDPKKLSTDRPPSQNSERETQN